MATFSTACDEPLSAPVQPAGPSPEQLRAVAEANRRARKLRRAATVAAFNGWSFGVFAALSLPFAFFSLSGLVMAVGLSVVTYNEFRGRRQLLRFEPRATRLLGWNQLGLMGLLVAYSLWSIAAAFAAPDPYAQYAELGAMMQDFGQLQKTLTLLVYGGLIMGTITFQGLNALYYFSRGPLVDNYLQETEHWVLEWQRATVT